MDPVYETSSLGVFVTITVVTLFMAIALSFVMKKEFIVASFNHCKPVHSLSDIWFWMPRQKPLDRIKAALVSNAPSSQLVVKYLQRKELYHKGKRGRSATASKNDRRNQKQKLQAQFLPSCSCLLTVALLASVTARPSNDHKTSKKPWGSNQKPEAMATSATGFCTEKLRRKIPAIVLDWQ